MEKVKSQSKTSCSRKAKCVLGVSKKFYDMLCKQVKSAASISKEVNEKRLMACIDEYIENGNVTADFSDVEKVVFTLLKSYINAAIIRSRRAREVAARRRSTKAAIMTDSGSLEAQQLTDTSLDTPIENDTPIEVPSTDESIAEETPSAAAIRKLQRREAKLNRRRMNHLKRLKRRGKAEML